MEIKRLSEPVATGPVTRWVGPPPFAQDHPPKSVRAPAVPRRAPAGKASTANGIAAHHRARARTAKKLVSTPAPARPKPVRARATTVRTKSTAQVLDELLRKNLVAGHWRAAVRHFYMLEYCDRELASRLRKELDVFEGRLLPREMERTRANARAWAELVALT